MSDPRDDLSDETRQHADPRALSGRVRDRPALRWRDAAGEHEVVVATRRVLGSAPGVDVVIADPTVSRIHAELDPRDDGLQVRDLGSRNGTFVDGVRVVHAYVAKTARLRLGAATLEVYPAAAAGPAPWPDARLGPLVGGSAAMRELFARIARVAPTESTVLVHGETGTGKELVAHAIHEASPRAQGPFVVIDCAALPENLLEAELFGHARGAFTGAMHARAGALEQADGGTVFLDEVGELPLAMQPKLLRALESRTVRRLGETAHRKVDVRFVTATHRDLRTMVNQGAFREDLYFRLAVVPLAIPPLRERVEDIAPLARHFLPRGASLEPALLAELARRPWLGNVRELRNFVERAVALGAHEALLLATAPVAPDDDDDDDDDASPPAVRADVPYHALRDAWLAHLERTYLRELLAVHGRNVSAVARAAGLDRKWVHQLLRKHGL